MRRVWLTMFTIVLLARPAHGPGRAAVPPAPTPAPAHAVAAPPRTTGGTGILRGVVRDPDGAIVVDATILIQHWHLKDGSLSHPVPLMEPLVYTDSQGTFSVQLPPALYDVFVSFPIFSPAAEEVKIEAGKSSQIEFDLHPSAFATYVY